jgi:hypothetical protein
MRQSADRATTIDAAFIAHPNRCKGIAAQPRKQPGAAGINPPTKTPLNPSTQLFAL